MEKQSKKKAITKQTGGIGLWSNGFIRWLIYSFSFFFTVCSTYIRNP